MLVKSCRLLLRVNLKKNADTERASGCLLVQNVLKSIADSKTPIYVHHIGAFMALQVTPDSHGMKGRFSDAEAKLTGVKWHKMFDLTGGIKKVVAIIHPNPFLVNEVMIMWNASPKDQSTMSEIIKHIRSELGVPVTPPSEKTKKQKKHEQWSGKSQSNGTSGAQRNHGKSQYRGNGKGSNSNNWRTSNASSNSRGNNMTQVAAQVNHMKAVSEARVAGAAEARAQMEARAMSEQNDHDHDERFERLENLIEGMVTVSHMDEMARAAGQPAVTSRSFSDVARVMQAQTRRRHIPRVTRALTEKERLKRAASMAKVTSSCDLDRGPLVDSATDTSVIGADSFACVTNIQSCEPFEMETISGTVVSKQRDDLKTPLLTILGAPIVVSSKTSIVANTACHDQGYTIVSDSNSMTLQKDGVSYEAVPDGNMYRLHVVDIGKIDDEVNHAVSLHRKTVLARASRRQTPVFPK